VLEVLADALHLFLLDLHEFGGLLLGFLLLGVFGGAAPELVHHCSGELFVLLGF
jgi:hypothetical protein